MLDTIENINKKMHVTGSLINLKTIQENFEKINAKDIHSEEEKQEIMDALNTIETEIVSIQEKIGFIRQMKQSAKSITDS
ncbi:hypothetical protein [Enterococcus hulanensis]|uniref:hypothetical protein n=1 Tax=Enterococcus hulanensis TaxID=2559929 RepID=UPI001485B7AA|nr:hypothetical protein [Enterococcus hulanensis]